MIIPNYVLRTEVQAQQGTQANSNHTNRVDNRIEEYNRRHASAPRSMSNRLQEDLTIATTAFYRSGFFRLLVQLTMAFVFFYFFLPWDLIPDEFGLFGYVDDLAIILLGFWFIFWLAESYRGRLLREVAANHS
eukprot:TRINITY_DN4924_c0_g2_i3.p1 TRINITY_DN4924_c0_g2~~TRINITY_DN4924_c0_g2_i3.p1  ORF type:complete len:133 (+),score=23.99 TRINITY_DN4924_c0_g2_i3:265-663(+)